MVLKDLCPAALLEEIEVDFIEHFRTEDSWSLIDIATAVEADMVDVIDRQLSEFGNVGFEEADAHDGDTLDKFLDIKHGAGSELQMGILNTWYDPMGTTGWDEAVKSYFEPSQRAHYGIQRLELRRHQKVGIVALVGKFFSPQLPKGEPAVPKAGILLADDVGVGKTATVIGFIAFLISAIQRQTALGAEALPGDHLLSKCEYSHVPAYAYLIHRYFSRCEWNYDTSHRARSHHYPMRTNHGRAVDP